MVENEAEKSSFYVFVTGICMGAADVIPGVSGGTIAFIMGIYEKLLAAVKSINLEFLRKIASFQLRDALDHVPWKFLFVLAAGIGTAIITLAKGLEYLLSNHETLLMAFFFGLILSSVIVLAKSVAWSTRTIVAIVIGSAFAFWLVGLVPTDPGHSTPILFGSGILTISATILPGISGSFILLILGQYTHCVATLNRMIDCAKGGDISGFLSEFTTTVLPLALGAIVGLMVFCRILGWLLDRYASVTIAVLTGFMVGSLRRIWPFKTYDGYIEDRHGEMVPTIWKNILPEAFDSTAIMAIALCATGFLLICVIDHLHDRRNPVLRLFWR